MEEMHGLSVADTPGSIVLVYNTNTTQWTQLYMDGILLYKSDIFMYKSAQKYMRLKSNILAVLKI